MYHPTSMVARRRKRTSRRPRSSARSGNAKATSTAFIQAMVADLRDFLSGGGKRSVFGVCQDAAYFSFDFLRKRVPDVHVVYGELAWDGNEPFAHWWTKSDRLGLIIDATNPFVEQGYVGPIGDRRYRESRSFKLTRRQLNELDTLYDGLSLDPVYYRNFAP